jgi:D-lactate dehydrogenase (cytochrome)
VTSPNHAHFVQVEAGVSVAELQSALNRMGRYYPPVPTFEGAFIGGTVATNAAGAATFKYGTTRRWIEAVTVVLADGSVVRARRGDVIASPDGLFEFQYPSGVIRRVPVPTYAMPPVPKLSAGYYAHEKMDLVDLFVGAEGTLGVIVNATLRTVPRPMTWLALIRCANESQALAVTAQLRLEATRAWRGEGRLDVAAIEYMDSQTVDLLRSEAFTRAGVSRPTGGSSLLLVQMEAGTNTDPALLEFQQILDTCDVTADPDVALPGDDRGAARLLELREAAPVTVNSLVAAAKTAVHPNIQKTAGDMVVPFDRLPDALAVYRDAFERRRLQYAIWGHLSDGNLHPNVLPRNLDDVVRGREAIFEIARAVISMGGAPLAEHGVGRSPLKQRLLIELYGAAGIEQMRLVKRALDPDWKLAPGVLFSESGEPDATGIRAS